MTLHEEIAYLKQCPTVGHDTAKKIIAYCGNIQNAATVSLMSKGKIPGISSKRGKKIQDWLQINLQP